jgi:ribosomal protein S18 acetylase RimI-like enzyme
METYVADLSDLDDLQRLVAAFRDHLERSQPDDTALRENLRRLVTTGGAEFFLAIDDTRRGVGYVQQRYRFSLWLGGLEATLEDLFVSPASRRQGVATYLVQFAIERAKKRGCRAIKLDTNEGNHEAIRLYQRLGFLSGSTFFSESRQLSFEKILEPAS